MNKVYRANTLNTALVMQRVATQNKKNQVVSRASSNLYNLLINNRYSATGTKSLLVIQVLWKEKVYLMVY